jgi:hypothetical protein
VFRILLAAVIGCNSTTTSIESVAPEQTSVTVDKASEKSEAKSKAVAPVRPPSSGEPIKVLVVWQGISPLHKTFFLDNAALEQLGRDLAGHVQPPANVYVSFDSKWHVGRILLRLLPGTGVDLEPGDANELNLGVISPVLQGLARYRARVAARYDTRVASFHVGIDSFRGPNHCRFSAVGPQPPDGTVVDGCVQLNGVDECGVSLDKSIRFEPETAEAIRACLK